MHRLISVLMEYRFLLAQIYLNSLSDKLTPKAIKSTLRSFRNTISGLGEAKNAEIITYAYEQAMLRINGQQSGFKELAHKVLLWIVCAERQLTTTELQHALAVETDEMELDKENLPSVQDMVSVCAGLVTVDYESNIIRLVHYTTQEYFNHTRKNWFPDADMIMADTCASYLLFKGIEEGDGPTDGDFMERSRLNPLYRYAAQNWGHHARKAIKLCHKVMEFLESEVQMNVSIEALRIDAYERGAWEQRPPVRGMTGLHLAAYFGIEETVRALLKKTIEVNTYDGTGSTPLSWSSCNGHENVVELLLSIPHIEVDSRNEVGHTPLSLAAENGHEAVVKLLLAMPSVNIKKRDIYLYGEDRGTALFKAAQNGHVAIIKLLLSAGASPYFGDDTYTPLTVAAEKGYEAAVRLLLASSDSWQHERGWALRTAVHNGYDAAVKLLLSAEADPNLSDDTQELLFAAATVGYEAVVKSLLAMPNIDINWKRPLDGATSLYSAAKKGHAAVVKLLLAAGADPDLRNRYGTTALGSAAFEGRGVLVELLLKAGVDPDIRGEFNRTPLLLAAEKGHEIVVELLLAAGADPDLSDRFGATPLLHAAGRGYISIVKLLLVVAANQNLRNNRGETPLSMAQAGGHEAVIKLLSSKVANLDLDDKDSKG